MTWFGCVCLILGGIFIGISLSALATASCKDGTLFIDDKSDPEKIKVDLHLSEDIANVAKKKSISLNVDNSTPFELWRTKY